MHPHTTADDCHGLEMTSISRFHDLSYYSEMIHLACAVPIAKATGFFRDLLHVVCRSSNNSEKNSLGLHLLPSHP